MTAIRSHVSASTAEVVADQDQRQPELRAQALEQLEDLRLHHHVERGRRLVGDHQRRPARERQRDHHPLALAARELVRVAAPSPRGSPTVLEQLGDPRRAPRPARLGSCSADRRRRSGCRRACTGSSEFIAPWKTSETWRQRTSCIPRSVRRSMLIGSSPSGGCSAIVALLLERGRQQPHQRQRGRRLAAARLARQPERLAARQRQVDAVDDRVAPRWRTVQPGDLEQRRSSLRPAAAG